MRQLKQLFGSWNRRDFTFVILLLMGLAIYISVTYFRSQSITIREIGTSLGTFVLLLLVMRLHKLARRTPPTPRVKYTVSMPLIEIIDEFTYTGYRVEAMTENTVVLVRFSIKLVILFLPLFLLLFIPFLLLSNSPQELSIVSFPVSIVSFSTVYLFAIAGYGYDRITFHQRFKDGPSTCVTSISSFLPSRVRASLVSTADHGDEAWYKCELDQL